MRIKFAFKNVCPYVRESSCMNMLEHLCMYVRACMCVSVCMFTQLCVCMCVCICKLKRHMVR